MDEGLVEVQESIDKSPCKSEESKSENSAETVNHEKSDQSINSKHTGINFLVTHFNILCIFPYS